MEDWLVILDDSGWRQALLEGQKSIATHRGSGVAQVLGSAKSITRRKSSLNVSKVLEVLKRQYRIDLLSVLEEVDRGKGTRTDAEKKLRPLFRDYFERAYALGLKAQGVGSRRKTSRIVDLFTEDDKHHIRTAVNEELRYMRKFLDSIISDNLFMSLEERARLYINGLDGIFGGGRIAALPKDSLIWWVGPMDKRKCESCEYLVHNSPYLPHTLATTPKSGETLCLSNCRDKLVVRKAVNEEIRLIEKGKSRKTHINALKRIRTKRRRK